MKWLVSLGVVVGLVVAFGSSVAAQVVADRFGGITGTITEVGDSEVLIEENPDESSGSDKSYVRVTPDTRITRRSGGAAGFEDLAVGAKVEARFSGPVAESYPTRAEAASIVVLEGGNDGALPDTGGAEPPEIPGMLAVALAAVLVARRLFGRLWRGLRARVL